MLSDERFTLPYGEEWYVRNVWREMPVSLRATCAAGRTLEPHSGVVMFFRARR